MSGIKWIKTLALVQCFCKFFRCTVQGNAGDADPFRSTVLTAVNTDRGFGKAEKFREIGDYCLVCLAVNRWCGDTDFDSASVQTGDTIDRCLGLHVDAEHKGIVGDRTQQAVFLKEACLHAEAISTLGGVFVADFDVRGQVIQRVIKGKDHFAFQVGQGFP